MDRFLLLRNFYKPASNNHINILLIYFKVVILLFSFLSNNYNNEKALFAAGHNTSFYSY